MCFLQNPGSAFCDAIGIPVWYSYTDIQGARQWHDEIGRALQRVTGSSAG